MKQTYFAKQLTEFLTVYLTGERGCSVNTVKSYRDTMLQFLIFMKSEYHITADRIDFKNITRERIVSFLEWIENTRHCGASTRNARLAALHAFFRYNMYKEPEQLAEWQRILSIKTKKTQRPVMSYLTEEGMKLLLKQPERTTLKGRRDLTLISLLFDSGARVQEIIDMTPSRVAFGKPTLLRITGKGNKTRLVPISEQASSLLRLYMTEHHLLDGYANEYPLFGNGRRNKLTRMGITAIIKKYAIQAKQVCPQLIPAKVTPHSLRHSKAVLLQRSGADLVCIRDFLGHASVTTTEIYARIDNEQKRRAIEKTSLSPGEEDLPSWQTDKGLLSWLESLGK